MKLFKRHKAKETTVLNIGIRECRTCENNLRCEECVYSRENEILKAEVERLNKEVDVLTQQIMKPFHEEREKCIKCEKELKSEAIKELSGRLYNAFSQMQREYRNILDSSGANAMLIAQKVLKSYEKEMVGEQE